MDDDGTTKLLSTYRAVIDRHLREQVTRTRSYNPGATTQQIKEIQRKQEIEWIDKNVDPAIRDTVVILLNDILKKL